jgi:hypothetical protein
VKFSRDALILDPASYLRISQVPLLSFQRQNGFLMQRVSLLIGEQVSTGWLH